MIRSNAISLAEGNPFNHSLGSALKQHTALAAGKRITGHTARMAPLNAATHFRIDHVLGSITPSRLADFMLLADLSDPRPAAEFVGGVEVARDGAPLFDNPDTMPDWSRATMHLAPGLDASSFAVRADGPTAWVQAVEMYDGYFKRAFHAELAVLDGVVQCDPDRDVLKVAIVDRHHATSTIGIGFGRGFGLRRAALAATTNCENQNLVILGTDDASIAHATVVAAELELIDVVTRAFTPVLLQPGSVCCRCPTHIHDVHRMFDPDGVLP